MLFSELRRGCGRSSRLMRACFEVLEERRLLAAPVLDAIAPVSLPAGKSIIIPITASDADGNTLTYSFSSNNPKIAAQLHTGNPFLRMSVAGFGDMDFEMLRDVSPRAVDTILGLVQAGYYDGLTFHRILQDFVLQGGDPDGTGNGGPGFTWEDEFNTQAIYTGSGQLAMAKPPYDDSNGSQFFITEGDQRHLDFNHAIFGQLIRGDAVREAIASVAVNSPQEGTPLVPPVITSMRIIQNVTDAVITITAQDASSGTITVNVSDGTSTVSRQISVTPVTDTKNDPPFLGPVSDVLTPVNTPVNIQLTSTDIDSGTPSYATSSIPASQGTISTNPSTGLVTVTPAQGYTGPIQFVVAVLWPTYNAYTNPYDYDAQSIVVGVGDKAISAQATPITTAVCGQAGTFQVATFTDSDVNGTAGQFSATVRWGDGQITNNATITPGPNNTFIVSASNTYRGEGTFPVSVTITGNLGAVARVNQLITVADAPLTAQGTNIAGTAGSALTNVQVATFTDGDPRGQLSDFSATIHWGDGQSSAGTVTARNGGGFAVSGSHTYAASGDYPVSVQINDVGGSTTTANATAQIGVINLPVDVGTAATIDEGGAISRTGSFTDSIGASWTATVDYGDGAGAVPLTLNPDKTFSLSHTYANSGAYVIAVAVSDNTGRTGVGTIAVTVNNVAPTATVAGDRNGVRNQPRTITLAATDISPADTAAGFSYNINWGDSSTGFVAVGESSATHTYAAAGTYTVTVRAVDRDGATGPAQTRVITIAAAQLQTDPANAKKKSLAVGGTNAKDSITLLPASNGRIQVMLGKASLGLFKPSGRIQIFGGAGNDVIQVNAKLAQVAELYGGAGNDKLTAGGGSSILLGGADKDTLAGGAARDLLIGGAAADALIGGDGDDILVAGTTAHDNNPAALRAIMKEWLLTTAYKTRLSHIKGPNGGANGSFFLNAGNAIGDGALDNLTGGAGVDWFFYNNDAGVKDALKDRLKTETATDID